MKALHRLAGNFPQRGYGLALRTAGFPADSEVFPAEGSRMPGHTMSMPYGRKPVDATNLVEMFHVFEIQPLAYGKLTSIFISNCAVKGTRPSGYVDAVYPDEAPADGVTSQTIGLEKMLRFNGFVDSRTFWEMSGDVNSMEATPWVEDEKLSLTFDMPQGWGEKELRALVATVWRTASYRRFGPWMPNNRQKCQYEDDRLLWHIPKMDRSLYVVLGEETLDDAIIEKAKGFLHFVYSKLPARMTNIASMSAAVSMDTIPGWFADSALCVVYPEANQNVPVDLRTGKCVEVDEEVHQMVSVIMGGGEDPMMADMLRRYAALTGVSAVELCSFSTDYDVYMSLYRLQHSSDVHTLLREWYAVNEHLHHRHGLPVETVQIVLEGVDGYVLSKLNAQLAQVEMTLCERERADLAKDAEKLRAFLWEKALATTEPNWLVLREIIPLVEKLDGTTFFVKYIDEESIVNDVQDARAADLMYRILMNYGVEQQLSENCLRDLVKKKTLIKEKPHLNQAMVQYLLEDHRRNVTRRPYMAPLTGRFLNTEDILRQELQLMRERVPEGLPSDEQCTMVREYWKQVENRQDCDRCMQAFMVDAFRSSCERDALDELLQKTYLLSVEPAGSPTSTVQNRAKATHIIDMTSSLCAILAACQASGTMLTSAQVKALFGAQGKHGLTRYCTSAQQVQSAWMAYIQPIIANQPADVDLYAWLADVQKTVEGAFGSQPKIQQELARFGAANCMQVILRRSGDGRLLPTDAAFSFIQSQPQANPDLFKANEPAIKSMYEALLAGENADAVRAPARAMLHQFYGTTEHPELRKLAVSCTQAKLREAWEQRGYWKGIEENRVELDSLGLKEEEILSDALLISGKKQLETELKGYSSVAMFRQAYGRYIDRKGKTHFYILWDDLLRRAFVARMGEMFLTSRSMQDVAAVCDAIRRLNVEKEASQTEGGRCISTVNTVNQLLANMVNPDQGGAARSYIFNEMNKAMQRLTDRQIRGVACAPHITELLRAEYFERRKDDLIRSDYLVRLCVSMTCAMNATNREIDWKPVLTMLCPNYNEMMEKPYAVSSLPLLQCVTALLFNVNDMYQQIRTPAEWLDSLYQFLHDDRSWRAYTDAVKDDRKQLPVYLPNYKDDMLISRWIQNRG